MQGAGSKLTWSVVVDDQITAAPTTTYNPPAITSVTGPGAVDAAVLGGQVVYIDGVNFGPANAEDMYNATFLKSVTYGPSGKGITAVDCRVLSFTRIICLTAPGIGR